MLKNRFGIPIESAMNHSEIFLGFQRGQQLLFALFFCAHLLLFPASGFAQIAQDSIAERMLHYQRDNGGWPQPGGDAIDYTKALTLAQQQKLSQEKAKLDATIDDRATTHEINYLVGAFQKTHNPTYRLAAERGIEYLLFGPAS